MVYDPEWITFDLDMMGAAKSGMGTKLHGILVFPDDLVPTFPQ